MRKYQKADRKKQKDQISGRNRKKQSCFSEEYIRRAEQWERELFDQADFSEEEEPAEEEEARSYEKLVNRLKEEGIYREEASEEHRKDTSRIISMHRGHRISIGKVAGIAILFCTCVFAASMTSEANRNYFVKGIRYFAGDDTRVLVDNNEENENTNMEEMEAFKNIEKELKIEMPEFYYRPKEFVFWDYEVNSYADVARIEYQYQDKIVFFYIDKENENSASKNNSMHGGATEILELNDEKITVFIQKSQDETSSYTAQWERENVLYHLSGQIELEEIKKMIEQMKF